MELGKEGYQKGIDRMKEHTIITLSRQYGSGGREVCQWLSRILNIPYFDREILLDAAAKSNIEEIDYKTLNDSSYKTNRVTFGVETFYPREAAQVSDNHQMFLHQSAVIKRIAKEGSAIFLGRCSDFLLKDYPDTFSFYTCADDEYREMRAREKYNGMTLKKLDKIDKKRRVYYQKYTGREMGNPENYDMILNMGKMTAREAAELIISYIEYQQKG